MTEQDRECLWIESVFEELVFTDVGSVSLVFETESDLAKMFRMLNAAEAYHSIACTFSLKLHPDGTLKSAVMNAVKLCEDPAIDSQTECSLETLPDSLSNLVKFPQYLPEWRSLHFTSFQEALLATETLDELHPGLEFKASIFKEMYWRLNVETCAYI